LISLQLKLFAIFAISVMVFAGTNGLFTTVHAQKLTKNQLQQCENLYYNYQKFGEAEFLKRYAFKSFIRDCIQLYKDPKWTFVGKDKIDQYFGKSGNVNNNDSTNPKLTISIKQKIKIDNKRFFTSFVACSTTKDVMPNFLFSTDKEQFIGSSTKMISANTCRTFSTYLNTQNSASISIQHVLYTTQYSHLSVKRL
jgi:hypothetical protein